MNNVNSSAPARQVDHRGVRLVQPVGPDGTGGAVYIAVSRGSRVTACEYDMDRVPSAWGEAYALTACRYYPEGDKTYHVCLDPQGHSCECLGFLRHDRCKHVEALLALKAAGKL